MAKYAMAIIFLISWFVAQLTISTLYETSEHETECFSTSIGVWHVRLYINHHTTLYNSVLQSCFVKILHASTTVPFSTLKWGLLRIHNWINI